MTAQNTTIAAVATPPGQGGVGIIRISGPEAKAVGTAIFRSIDPEFSGPRPYRLHYGHILDTNGAELDDVLLAYMPGPKSYTGEDVVELHCHGGQAVLAAVLETVLANGAVMAKRGQFTKRAFMNGRMDLTQAEAVAEVIAAPNKGALHLAQVKRSGMLGKRIEELRATLEELRAKLCLAVDFPEEDVECLPPAEIAAASMSVVKELETLVAAMERTKAWREGALVVLAGMVNVGKSSLMNALLGRDRAIVTDQPGTTRDYLEEHLNLDGITVRITDTAGIRQTDDAIEEAGLEAGKRLMDEADLILYVVDNSETLAHENVDACIALDPAKTIAVMNKLDIIGAEPPPWKIFKRYMYEIIKVSAKTGKNLDKLCDRMRARLLDNASDVDPDEIAPNARQAAMLREAIEELKALQADAQADVPHDLLGVRLEAACSALDAITGRITPGEVLNSIFDSFCIGK